MTQVFAGSTGDLIITAVGTPNHGGSVTIATDGKTVNYTPARQFLRRRDVLLHGQRRDGRRHGHRDRPASRPMNDNPTAVNDVFTVTEDAVSIALNVLANDLITPDTGETLQVLELQRPVSRRHAHHSRRQGPPALHAGRQFLRHRDVHVHDQ